MLKTTITILALATFALGFAACGMCTSSPDDQTDADGGCVCDQGKAGETVWCADCSVGYVGGKKTACQSCITAKTGGPACEACTK